MPENPSNDIGLEGKLQSKARLEGNSAVQGHRLLRLVRKPLEVGEERTRWGVVQTWKDC